IEYEELRESVKSLWRKQSPAEPPLRIVAFVIPRGDLTPTDYYILPHSDYQSVINDISLDESRMVFYELEYSHTPGGSASTVFNEYIVLPRDVSEGILASSGSCASSLSDKETE
ncbi:hypothetical protein LPJ56_007235, partial [Coemansia sp. RSA 2599]